MSEGSIVLPVGNIQVSNDDDHEERNPRFAGVEKNSECPVLAAIH